jgi:GNAT superfamily N-acetyltransferase
MELARQRKAYVAVWRADAATRPAGAWADLAGLAVHATGLPVRLWNGAQLTAPEGLPRLPEARAWFARRGLPWALLVPAELDLEPPAMTHLIDQPVMLRDLRDLPEVPDLTLRWTSAADAAAVQQEAFETELALEFVTPKLVNPTCAVVTAYDGGVPVSTATLVVTDRVAGVYGVATVAGHRQRGLGRAVTLAVLHEAARRGCDLAFLNPSPSGYAVYARLGFTDALPWRVWIDPG